jgi:hypothetical protein
MEEVMDSPSDNKKAPDGTDIIRHETFDRKIGFTDKPDAKFRQMREDVYTRMFGNAFKVSHELIPQVPHIDVYIFRRSLGGKDCYSLVTGGMSDLRMTLPLRAPRDVPQRVELIFYCSEPRDEYIKIQRWVAHFPHDAKSFLGHGHTMPNGNPPEPFWGSTELDTLFFLPPIVKKDQTLPSELQLEGDPVHFLWMVPLTSAECDFKLRNGFEAMLNLFQRHHHLHVFDPHRKSYV